MSLYFSLGCPVTETREDGNVTYHVVPLVKETSGSYSIPSSLVGLRKFSVANIVAAIIQTLESAKKRPTQIL